LASSWCKDELEWFREEVRDRSRDRGRVFIVRAFQTDENGWPVFLRDERGHALVGFRFYDPRTGRPLRWRGEWSEDYVRQLWTLQTALTKRLRELRRRAESRLQAETRVSPDLRGPSRRVYLHSRVEDAPIRDEIRRLLSGAGMALLSPAVVRSSALADWVS